MADPVLFLMQVGDEVGLGLRVMLVDNVGDEDVCV